MSFTAYHTKIHGMLKHHLSPAKLESLFSDLNTKFTKHIVNSWGETGTRMNIVLVLRQMIGITYLIIESPSCYSAVE